MPAADVHWKRSGMQAFFACCAGSQVLLCANPVAKVQRHNLHACRIAVEPALPGPRQDMLVAAVQRKGRARPPAAQQRPLPAAMAHARRAKGQAAGGKASGAQQSAQSPGVARTRSARALPTKMVLTAGGAKVSQSACTTAI